MASGEHRRTRQNKSGAFEQVSECLYRYAPTGSYYARLEVNGKEVRRSLSTRDGLTAKRKLLDLQRDLMTRTAGAGGRASLAQICDRQLGDRQHSGFVSETSDACGQTG